VSDARCARVTVYTKSEIDFLLSCPKKISDPPKTSANLVNADFRNDMRLTASQGLQGEFRAFMRQNEDFPENFSVGLIYCPNDGRPDITLLRCNGPHGVYNGSPEFDSEHPHWDYHVHRADERALDAGFKAERFAEKSTEFASYEQALDFFVREINLDPDDIRQHFAARTLFN
jgi:hypothetical protein